MSLTSPLTFGEVSDGVGRLSITEGWCMGMGSGDDAGDRLISCYDSRQRVAVHPSALKHEVLEAEILAAWCTGPGRECWLDDKEPRRLLRIGWTTDGRDVEVVALVFDQDRVLIIHAMPARRVAYDYVRRSRLHER